MLALEATEIQTSCPLIPLVAGKLSILTSMLILEKSWFRVVMLIERQSDTHSRVWKEVNMN